MEIFTAQQATPASYDLAESPVWDSGSRRLYWVDIPAGAVVCGDLDAMGIHETGRFLFSGTAGAVGLAADGGLIVAAEKGLATIDPTGLIHLGPHLLSGGPDSRFNDGACDSAGRFVVGSLSRRGREATQVLLQAEPEGEVRVLREGLGLSNGIAWSPSDDVIYHVDTATGSVWRAAYDAATGAAAGWRVLVQLTDGVPDGLAVDEEGMIWVAIWGAGQVRRYDPAGVVSAVIDVDAPLTTSVTFAGPDLSTMVITTAREGLSSAELEQYPSSGALFVVRTGIHGWPEHRWGGDTTSPKWAPNTKTQEGIT